MNKNDIKYIAYNMFLCGKNNCTKKDFEEYFEVLYEEYDVKK
jgi:hypothetical protein